MESARLCEFLIIKTLCDYAMSSTMPMIEKEEGEKKQRHRTGGREDRGLDELQRKAKRRRERRYTAEMDLKIKLSCLVCFAVWLNLKWKPGFMAC